MIYPPNKELLLRYDSMFGWGDSLISFIGVEKEETICFGPCEKSCVKKNLLAYEAAPSGFHCVRSVSNAVMRQPVSV